MNGNADVTPNQSDADDGELAKPRTAVVLALLAGTSLTFSYLGAYALSGALVQADVLHQWTPDADPRPRWLAIAFFTLLTSFLCIAGVARFLSGRQLRKIDEMSDDAAAQE